MRGELVSPNGAVGAVVLDLQGIAEVLAVDGRIFTEPTGEGIRAVFILDTPGLLEFSVRMHDVTGTPSATVIDVADADNVSPATLEGYHVRFSL
jgi:hypothetical protein